MTDDQHALEAGRKVYRTLMRRGRPERQARRDAERWVEGNLGVKITIPPPQPSAPFGTSGVFTTGPTTTTGPWHTVYTGDLSGMRANWAGIWQRIREQIQREKEQREARGAPAFCPRCKLPWVIDSYCLVCNADIATTRTGAPTCICGFPYRPGPHCRWCGRRQPIFRTCPSCGQGFTGTTAKCDPCRAEELLHQYGARQSSLFRCMVCGKEGEETGLCDRCRYEERKRWGLDPRPCWSCGQREATVVDQPLCMECYLEGIEAVRASRQCLRCRVTYVEGPFSVFCASCKEHLTRCS